MHKPGKDCLQQVRFVEWRHAGPTDQFVAIDNQPAATTSLMLAPTPFLVALLSQRSLGESVRRRQVGGAALMVCGAALYFAGDLVRFSFAPVGDKRKARNQQGYDIFKGTAHINKLCMMN